MKSFHEQVTLEHSTFKLNAHVSSVCQGTVCSIHNRTDHHMRSFPQWYSWSLKVMMRVCPHGVRHYDPDDYRVYNGLIDMSTPCSCKCCKDEATSTLSQELQEIF